MGAKVSYADIQLKNLMKTTPQNHSSRGHRHYSTIEALESRIAPATIVVNSLLDTVVTGKMNLRQALAQADTDLLAHPGVVNKIVFNLPAAAAGTENTITLGGTALSSNGDVDIVGPGAGKLIINGNNASGDIFIGATTGVTTISGVSIINGMAANGGGGIYCSESLTLKNVVISGNTSTAFGSGVNIHGNNTAAAPKINIINSQITGNSHGNSGSSGIFLYEAGSFSITNTVISGNARGISSEGATTFTGGTIKNSLISSNADTGFTASNNPSSAKITISGTRITGNTSSGARFDSGNVLITGSSIEDNTALYYGGGIYSSVTTSLTISKSTIAVNRTTATNGADQGGGGIFVSGPVTGTPEAVKIISSKIEGNSSALDGGGIFAQKGVALSVTGSTFAANQAAGAGGGIATRGVTASGVVNLSVMSSAFSDNISSRGGAIAAQGTTGLEGNGTFSIIASLVAGNSSTGADGGINVATSADVTIKNTIVTNNFAAAFAGGLDVIDTQTAKISGGLIEGNSALGVGGGLRLFQVAGTIKNATITGNAATSTGGGIYEAFSANLVITSSNVTGNTAPSDADIRP
jgi:hypothetical protein